MYAQLLEHLRSRRRTPHVVHRIDRDTSGLVVFAKDARTQQALKEQFIRREPERVYLAVVIGHPSPAEGTWRDHLAWDRASLVQQETHGRDPRGVEAVSRYRVVEPLTGASLIEVRLHTGKRNQIRIQAALRGHPLIGERQYVGLAAGAAATGRRLRFHRQALHAWRLGFEHPAEAGHSGSRRRSRTTWRCSLDAALRSSTCPKEMTLDPYSELLTAWSPVARLARIGRCARTQSRVGSHVHGYTVPVSERGVGWSSPSAADTLARAGFASRASGRVTRAPVGDILALAAGMFPTPPNKPRTIRAMRRRRATPPPAPTRLAPEPEPELSNYELIERRSRELEIERAHGGPGTSQPPDAETPLLFSKPTDASEANRTTESGRTPLGAAEEVAARSCRSRRGMFRCRRASAHAHSALTTDLSQRHPLSPALDSGCLRPRRARFT